MKIIIILLLLASFATGAIWMQIKETKFGIKAKYICERCEAEGCQAKWCKMRRNKRGD